MKIIDQSKAYQVESLINECKGNIFEFLVTQKLSRHFKREDKFILSLPKDFRHRFAFYEEVIRKFDPSLLATLNDFSNVTVEELLKTKIFNQDDSYEFNVIGKMVATNDNDLWNETDIVVTNLSKKNKKSFISLKLIKDNSYTNTKSAGVKSFLDKYFRKITPLSAKLQKELNQEVDESFLMMGHRLYGQINESFSGSFDSKWTNVYSELPGELPDNLRQIVLDNYARIAKKLRDSIEILLRSDKDLFYESLFALCGYSSKDIIQVQCYHHNNKIKSVEVKDFKSLFKDDPNEIKVGQLSDGGSLFDVEFEKFNLQIRIKPMNKFTTAAYKVNCSIKVKAKK